MGWWGLPLLKGLAFSVLVILDADLGYYYLCLAVQLLFSVSNHRVLCSILEESEPIEQVPLSTYRR